MHVVAGLLARNIDVFVLDADAVWNQDVLAYLAGIRRLYAPEIGHEQGPDIVGQRGSFPQALGEATLGSTLCGGMIFFRASPAVAQLFDVIAHHMDMFEYDDQVAVNALLFQAAGGQQLAPLRKHKHNAMPIPDHWIWLTPSENQDLSPTALHLNYVDSRQLALARVIPSSAKLGHEIVMRLQANITVGYLPHSAFPRRCPTEINSDELVAIHCFGDTSSSRYNRLVALDLWFLDSSP
ncbi:uncharacterized protein MONBRDRAFT_34438 [Monosiga brevicollis MX1]|uniref:Nucleotide-diphospho-sugar transferase domain-containing protein n=1 Tax=Monosiga brevicollis TaxID=81824 RepID=A9VBS6_MONBE|nr:uncharacterized protein MONBRDRAFT_34438 [Monosiga brevicollis MX1]EDQ84984.1 predicted protein [Monosiga brevicollis MX1]|eukprot:XP_001750154.1 hypothetical protein [Monosiga brevicollis MX1]